EESAGRFANRPAIAWFGRHISYGELLKEVERFSAALASLGVKSGDRVGLILPNCPQYVIAYYATVRLGAVIVGNNPLYTQGELDPAGGGGRRKGGSRGIHLHGRHDRPVQGRDALAPQPRLERHAGRGVVPGPRRRPGGRDVRPAVLPFLRHDGVHEHRHLQG